MPVTTESPEAVRAREQHGLTNDPIWIERVRTFVAAAVADGWAAQPTYGSSEPVERAAKLSRDGFVIQVLARDYGDVARRYRYEATLHGWGPDGLTVRLPDVYDMDAIRAAVTRCNLCEATDVKTFRYSFAGRCCEACVPAARAQYEKPGWDN